MRIPLLFNCLCDMKLLTIMATLIAANDYQFYEELTADVYISDPQW